MKTRTPSSGTYYFSFEEIFGAAKNVYIGKLVETGEKEAVSSRNSVTAVPAFEHVIVEVQENYKGSFQKNMKVDDLVLSTYHDFLEVGSTYLFMTGIDYFLESPVYYPFNLYEVVKIKKDNQIEIYKLNEFTEKGNYSGNKIASPPADLDEIHRILERLKS